MKTKENENNSTPKSDLILKIHNELLIVSKAFDKMSNYFNDLTTFIELNEDENITDIENKEKNNLDGLKLIPSIKNNNQNNESKQLVKKSYHLRRLGKRKLKRREISSKLYTVQTIQNDQIKIGYRIFCKYLKVSMCFGPYSDHEFALNLRKNLQTQLKLFDEKAPNIENLIKKFLSEVKIRIDLLHPPVRMVRISRNNK